MKYFSLPELYHRRMKSSIGSFQKIKSGCGQNFFARFENRYTQFLKIIFPAVTEEVVAVAVKIAVAVKVIIAVEVVI